jgi:Ca-activated chloride channel homolog
MTFLWPAMLTSILGLPVLIYLYLRMMRRRQQIAARFGSMGLVSGASGAQAERRRHLPPLLFLLGLLILSIALARPQAVVGLPRMEGTVILAFDVSGSMAAEDLQPTRLAAAKSAAQAFVARLPVSVQVGVVAFSDSGFSVQAPTNEEQDIRASIHRLTTQSGTSLGQGIYASLHSILVSMGGDATEPGLDPLPEAFRAAPTGAATGETYPSSVIVLLSDGENTSSPDPIEAAQITANYGVRIFTVGIGSPQGVTLEVNGFMVHTQLQEALLKEIALLTGGEYFNAQESDELLAVYENLIPQLVTRPEKIEVTSLFAGAGLLTILLGSIFSLVWFGRIP